MPNRPKKHGCTPKSRKTWSFILSMAVNVVIIVFIALREFGANAGRAQSAAHIEVNLVYLLLGLACLIVAIAAETQKYHAMMMATSGRADLRGAFECAVLGKYYDNITPLGAGGQPFQMHYLKRLGLSNGASAALPIAGFLTLQLAFVLIAALVFSFNGSVAGHIAAIRISAYVGLGFYAFIPLCIILFSLMPDFFTRLICACVRLLSKIRIIKDYDRAVASITGSLREYRDSLRLLRETPFLLLKLMLYSLIYQAAILSIPYFVLLAFGGGNSWWTVFSLVVFVYAAITIIPTPGNAGAAEGSFYAVFSSLTSGYLFWAMVIWRVLVYYSWLAMGLIIIAAMRVSGKSQPRRERPSDAPLRVALFTDVFYPTIDGVVRTVDSYAKRMNQNGNCCVVCPRPIVPYEDDRSYRVLRTPAVKVPGISYLFPAPRFSSKLRRFFKENQFDVFHAHSPFFIGEFAVAMGRKLGVPVIATFHSKYYDDTLNITHSKIIARLVTNRIVRFYCKADEVWACGEGAADTLRSYGFKGDIHVMDNGADEIESSRPATPSLPPEALCRRAMETLAIPQGRKILLFVGQLIWHKNLRLILDVTKRLRETDDSFITVMAGQGYNGDEVRAYTKELKLGDAVLFTGQISDHDLLRGLYLSADLFFFPSVYDNSPLVVREAALYGLPSLLAEGSCSAGVVTDGVNGFTAEADCAAMTEKIRTLFSGCDLRAVGERARQTIPVSWDEIVRRVERRYRTVEKRGHVLDEGKASVKPARTVKTTVKRLPSPGKVKESRSAS